MLTITNVPYLDDIMYNKDVKKINGKVVLYLFSFNNCFIFGVVSVRSCRMLIKWHFFQVVSVHSCGMLKWHFFELLACAHAEPYILSSQNNLAINVLHDRTLTTRKK
jgi:hypothetical protein